MNVKKTIQVVGMVLSSYSEKSLNYTKLLKMLYFMNRRTLKEKGYALIDDKVFNMENGVVLSGTYDLIKNKYDDSEAQSLWNSFFETSDYDIMIKESVSLIEDELSEYEEEVVKDNIEQYRNQKYSEMINLHHDPSICPEWKSPSNGKSEVLRTSDILRVLGYTEKEIKYLEEEERVYQEEDKIFEHLANV